MKKQTKTNVWLAIVGALGVIPVLVSSLLTFKTSLQEIEPNLTFFFLVLLLNVIIILIAVVWIGSKATNFLERKVISEDGYFIAFFSAIGLSLLLVGITIAIKTVAPDALQLIPDQPLKYILISTFYQGITVEICFRFFLLASSTALLTLIKIPKTISFIISLIGTSLLAALLTIPSIGSEQLNISFGNIPVLLSVVLLFGIPNIVYGLLFWKKSLAAAALAHILTFLLYNFIIYSFLRFTIL